MTIPGYEFLQKLEESDTATLWRGRQESLDREVAIKILKPEFINQEDEVRAFLREARAVAKLKSTNIIQVYDVGQHENSLFIVMECVNGYPLTTLLDLGDPMAQKRALLIALSVAQALSDAWTGEKLIHRNIKPGNIMVEKGGAVKVANLGMSGIADQTPGMIIGTPNYMSPEQASASPSVSFTSDMYSLGAVLYHMVTGQVPFDNMDEDAVLQAQIEGQLPFPQDLNPDITPPCAQLIARLMMKDPQKRYPDWQGAIHDITKLADGKMIVARPLAGAGSTIAAKGAGGRMSIKAAAAPRKMIITRPPVATTGAPVIAVATAAPRANASAAVASASPPSAPEKAARAAALKKKYGKPTTPLWIKLPLTAALMALFGWLGLTLLWQPYREAYPRVAVVTPPPVNVQPLPPRPTRPQPPPTPSETETPEETAPNDYAETPAPSPTPAPEAATPPPAPEPPSPRLNALRNSLVNTALTDGMDAAARTLSQQQGTAPAAELDALARFFAPANQPEAVIADAFNALIGKETYITMGSRRIEFRVEAVNGDTISTMVKSTSGNGFVFRPAELKIGQLPLEEQRRWLGETATPEKAFASVMLDLSSANYAEAAKQSEKCGVLADSTRAFFQKRIDMLLE